MLDIKNTIEELKTESLTCLYNTDNKKENNLNIDNILYIKNILLEKYLEANDRTNIIETVSGIEHLLYTYKEISLSDIICSSNLKYIFKNQISGILNSLLEWFEEIPELEAV